MKFFRFLMVLMLGLFLFSDFAQAGPIRDRVRSRLNQWRANRQARFGYYQAAPGCPCGPGCACAPGVCPQGCPVPTGGFTPWLTYRGVGTCPNCTGPSCPVPQVLPSVPVAPKIAPKKGD